MVQLYGYMELRRQAGEIMEKIPTGVAERQGINIDTYYSELCEQYAPEAVRSALWNLISNQTIELQQPGNTLRIKDRA